jgi:hypothetical protein
VRRVQSASVNNKEVVMDDIDSRAAARRRAIRFVMAALGLGL